GTDPVYVGRVSAVQVEAVTASGTAPRGMRLALVDPGTGPRPVARQPAVGTSARLTSGPTSEVARTGAPARGTGAGTGTGASASPTAAAVTGRPKIFARRQWGADERMRDKPSLHYG